MFRGFNQIALDSKGRMAIPTRYRDELRANGGGRLIVTVNISERALWLYTLPVWEPIEAQVSALPTFGRNAKDAARLKRYFLGHATDVEMDANGRVLLPAPLRDYAQLGKQIVLAGQGNKFEIWSEANWSAQNDEWIAGLEEGPLSIELDSLSL